MVNLFKTLAALIAEYLDGKRTLSSQNIAKLEMYAVAELNNTERDMAHDILPLHSEAANARTEQLTMKINQLLMAMEPGNSFLL